MSRLVYFVGRALRGMRQALFINVVAVLTMAIALFVVSVFAGAVGQMQSLLDAWGQDIVVAIYLDDDASAEDVHRIKKAVAFAAGEDSRVEHIARDEALERLRNSLGEDAGILEGLDRNPLPASVEVRGGVTKEGPEALQNLAELAMELPGVTEADYGREWVSRLEGLITLGSMAGFLVGGLILLAAVVTVSNTIRLALFARKDEIEIMKLCGATDSFVRAPFLIEGGIQGTLGATVALLSSLLLWLLLLPRIEQGLTDAFAMQVEVGMPAGVLVLLVPGGALLGLAGAALSVGRFLRV